MLRVKLDQACERAGYADDGVAIAGLGSRVVVVVPRGLGGTVDAMEVAVGSAHQDLISTGDAVHGRLDHGDRESGSRGGVGCISAQLQHAHTRFRREGVGGGDHTGIGAACLPDALAESRRREGDQKCEENAREGAELARPHEAPHEAEMSVEALRITRAADGAHYPNDRSHDAHLPSVWFASPNRPAKVTRAA